MKLSKSCCCFIRNNSPRDFYQMKCPMLISVDETFKSFLKFQLPQNQQATPPTVTHVQCPSTIFAKWQNDFLQA